MKKLIRNKGVFNCTFKSSSKYKTINGRNEIVNEWKQNKVIYLKSEGIVIASVDIYGKLTLYPTWKETRSNLINICKFTGVSTTEIRHMIKIKHCDIILKNEIKIIN